MLILLLTSLQSCARLAESHLFGGLMASVKAALTVVLRANDVVVAEVEDAILWQRILTAINSGRSDLGADLGSKGSSEGTELPAADRKGESSFGTVSSPVDLLAQQIGIDVALVQGACSPTIEAPYMHFDLHCWEDMKKQLPQRGPMTVSPIVASATMLAL